MDKTNDLEAKYQKLAAEYSKVRSQAAVLKKAVLDEQAKNLELKDIIKKHEQQIRKHDQEMESLTFRNEQLTKRITVLQQELQINSHLKKSKNRTPENITQSDMSVLNEELQKKILENAQLVSNMADKDYELDEYREKVIGLERQMDTLIKESQVKEEKHLGELKKLKKLKHELEKQSEEIKNVDRLNCDVTVNNKTNDNTEEMTYWKEEAERWHSECEVLRSKPKSNEELTEYYESQLTEILEAKQFAQSETKTLWGENLSLYSRLEDLTLASKDVENSLEINNEELQTTIINYKAQLDAMTEHLAAQNDKITRQCDEIQALKHKLASKK